MDGFNKYRIEELEAFLEKYFDIKEKIGSRYGAQSEYFNDLCGKNTHFIDSPIYKHIKEEIEFLASLMQEDIKYV